jgi:hypothetical protein
VKSVSRELEAKARDLAGLKGHVTSLAACPDGTPVTADFVQIQAGRQTITAADPLSDDLRQALEAITHAGPRTH